MNETTLTIFGDSLGRCTANPGFEERFYEVFLASSPKVAAKFANTDFIHQRRALRASLHTMLLAVTEGKEGLDKQLGVLAERHSASDLDIGAELYDYWLDSLLITVQEFDPEISPDVQAAWEDVMSVGIGYLLSRY